MNKGIIFIAGIYGVGKSTLCSNISDSLLIPSFSASDLISEINGELYGPNKAVKDKKSNQDILIKAAKNKLNEVSSFILAGHFCIFSADNEVEVLPEYVFAKLQINQFILLEADINQILNNIYKRDNKQYSIEALTKLSDFEHSQAVKVSTSLGIPLAIHKMKFDKTDTEAILNIIQGGIE